MADSVFDRLAHQGTAASNARVSEENESRGHHQQLRTAEAVLTPLREQLKPPQDQAGRIKSPRRTPKQQDAFFNRLSKQETISSAAHHIFDHKSLPNHLKSPTTVSSPGEQSAVFNRLSKQETATSMAHHVKEDPCSPKKVNTAPLPSLQTTGLEYRCGHPTPIKMKLHIRYKEDKKAGKSYSNLDISNPDVRRQINLFHSGKISAHALTFDVINALFDNDFKYGAHWEIGTAMLDELDPLDDKTLLVSEEGDKFEVFQVEKQAIWDWKDIYSVATGKATIKISSGDIYVDEYSYYVAG